MSVLWVAFFRNISKIFGVRFFIIDDKFDSVGILILNPLKGWSIPHFNLCKFLWFSRRRRYVDVIFGYSVGCVYCTSIYPTHRLFRKASCTVHYWKKNLYQLQLVVLRQTFKNKFHLWEKDQYYMVIWKSIWANEIGKCLFRFQFRNPTLSIPTNLI